MTELSMARVTGPLAVYVEGFCAELAGRGYRPSSVQEHGRLMAALSLWLVTEHLGACELTPAVLERFLGARRRAGQRRLVSTRSARPLLDYLREAGVAPAGQPPVAQGPVEELLGAYRRYLFVERRLAPATVGMHELVAGRFLAPRVIGGALELEALTAREVTAFVLGEARLRSVGMMKAMLSPLRSLLRFLFVVGIVPRDLSAAVPAVASPQLASLPQAVDEASVAALLGSCDRHTSVGRRDFAILTVMVRLGLRAGEVAALTLEDVDWRVGELVVHGKGNRLDRLPLPVDVGEALADYLAHGRRPSRVRALFLRACAPDGAISPGAVVMVPRSASRRAGLPVIGAHRLRHTVASQMLRHGARLAEIAEVLRHRSTSTTALYAKIDQAALDLLVRPWPGARR